MKIKQGSTWRDVPPGGNILEPGTSVEIKTGAWRQIRPVLDKDKCNGCLLCWKFCPEACINVVDGMPVIDFDYCKGCGICEVECPRGAIVMEQEARSISTR